MSQIPIPSDRVAVAITDDTIRAVVFEAMQITNAARPLSSQLAVSVEAPLFGPDSPLDSIGLLSLLLDVEDGLQGAGWPLRLSDDRAMSQTRSPFRSVASLVEYIGRIARE